MSSTLVDSKQIQHNLKLWLCFENVRYMSVPVHVVNVLVQRLRHIVARANHALIAHQSREHQTQFSESSAMRISPHCLFIAIISYSNLFLSKTNDFYPIMLILCPFFFFCFLSFCNEFYSNSDFFKYFTTLRKCNETFFFSFSQSILTLRLWFPWCFRSHFQSFSPKYRKNI